MQKLKQNLLQFIGVAGTATCLVLFARYPSFPTPDKILIFLIFVFLIFKQATTMLKRMLPFIAVLLAYESFRGFADQLNQSVNFTLAPNADERLFGSLPTIYLQDWLWRGSLSWYDFMFYGAYLLHFILPIGLAILVWKTKAKHYWTTVSAFAVVAFAAFITYALLPAAPPWMAAEQGYIPGITRVSSNVWAAFGLQDFPSVYNQISPNAVAAVPSLHAAWAALFALLVYKLYGRKWGLVSSVYPALIFVGTVYQGEHYAFDVLLGAAYAVSGYYLTLYFAKRLSRVKFRSKKRTKLRPAKAH